MYAILVSVRFPSLHVSKSNYIQRKEIIKKGSRARGREPRTVVLFKLVSVIRVAKCCPLPYGKKLG
jgi:hypothetical protein